MANNSSIAKCQFSVNCFANDAVCDSLCVIWFGFGWSVALFTSSVSKIVVDASKGATLLSSNPIRNAVKFWFIRSGSSFPLRFRSACCRNCVSRNARNVASSSDLCCVGWWDWIGWCWWLSTAADVRSLGSNRQNESWTASRQSPSLATLWNSSWSAQTSVVCWFVIATLGIETTKS